MFSYNKQQKEFNSFFPKEDSLKEHDTKEHNTAFSAPRVLTILPHKERFSPQEAGAISLLVRRMILPGEYVVGHKPTYPVFRHIPFIPIIPTPKTFSFFGERARYIRAVRRIVQNNLPHLVEVHNLPDMALDLCRTFPYLPVVLVLHNDPCTMRSLRNPTQREKLAKKITVIAVSDWIRDRFLDQNTHALVTVLPNSLDFSEIPPLAQVRAPVLLYVGRVVFDKGVDSYVTACSMLLPRYPHWRGVIIGANGFGTNLQTKTPFLQNLHLKAAETGIEIRGYQPHTEVIQTMCQAAIVVVPSRWEEPFGMVALEAMASGAALVTTRRGSLPYVAGEAALYINDPDNPKELATQIERLMCNPSLLQHYAQAGLTRARLFDSHHVRIRRQRLHKEIIQNTATTL